MNRPPDPRLLQLIDREVNRRGEFILFIDKQYNIVAQFWPEYDPDTLRQAREFWEQDLIAVITVVESIFDRTVVVEYLPETKAYTRSIRPSWAIGWDAETNEEAVAQVATMFEEGVIIQE